MTKINLNEVKTLELIEIIKVIEDFVVTLKKEEEEVRKKDNGKSKEDTAED